MIKEARAIVVLTGLWLCLSSDLSAHDPGLSYALIRLEEGRIRATLTFAYGDIATIYPMDRDLDGRISASELEAFRPRLEALSKLALKVSLDGRDVPASEGGARLEEATRALVLTAAFPGVASEALHLRSAILSRLPRGHRQVVSIEDEKGNTLIEQIIDARNDSVDVLLKERRAPGSAVTPALQFLVLGVEHIVTGYDHLAFLLALLIAGGSLMAAAKIITSFTVAHSLTLALATLGVVQVRSSVVEPLIAVSIIYVGLENLFRKNLGRRWLLTFAFGLIHGFGFATVLRDMGIGSGAGGVVTPLLFFNLGVEVGQITIASVLLPIILRLRGYPTFVARYAPACSILVSSLGGYWLIERVLLKSLFQ